MCKDNNDHCSHWAEVGECTSNPAAMTKVRSPSPEPEVDAFGTRKWWGWSAVHVVYNLVGMGPTCVCKPIAHQPLQECPLSCGVCKAAESEGGFGYCNESNSTECKVRARRGDAARMP